MREILESWKLRFSVPTEALLAGDAMLTAWCEEGLRPNDGPSLRRRILDATPEEQLWVVFAGLSRLLGVRPEGIDEKQWKIGDAFVWQARDLMAQLLQKPLPWRGSDLTAVFYAMTSTSFYDILNYLPIKGLIRAAAREADKGGLPADLRAGLERLRQPLEAMNTKHWREIADEITEILGDRPLRKIEGCEAWSDEAIEFIRELPEPPQGAWHKLIALCHGAEGSKPSKKWLKQAGELVAVGGEGVFRQRMSEWLPLLSKPRTIELPAPTQHNPDANLLISDTNEAILKGLAWACAAYDDPTLARALADGALACFKKIPNHGPRSAKVGNACLFALSAMPTAEAAAQLARVSAVIKQPTGKKMAARALDAIGQRTGQSADDLAEMSVPNYGLTDEGMLRRRIGSFTVELRITGSTDLELSWTSEAGKAQKSVPAEVRRDHAQELKELQRNAKDIEKMLPAQRARLERLLINPRQWPFEQWRQRYLAHPLLCNMTRRLIWEFKIDGKSAAGIWLDGKMVDAQKRPVEGAREAATVGLWHPIESNVETIRAWREFLQEQEISQPFKQAHREIYILTDAERRTNTYSNRFAGHIIRQHQFVALCQQRGWKTALQGGWDGGDTTPTLQLPQWNLRAEYWTEIAEDGALNDMGVANYLRTDQVRFIEASEREPTAVANVPPRVFSEVMRDVDLFVAVCSVGNDPQWRDAGDRTGDYWHHYSFGDLGETAKTRRAVIERLLPRLKIVSRCSLEERFLVVRGDLRTYKIHLGSGNILMEPNDQYLCIVPARGGVAQGRDGVFLPFEGDSTLSVILSKAFMLADDRKITDETITRQINTAK